MTFSYWGISQRTSGLHNAPHYLRGPIIRIINPDKTSIIKSNAFFTPMENLQIAGRRSILKTKL